ncbi:MAG: hypothetical protein IT323_15125, partial [Anaerolineae bacterium]|nr:hypothetical protein [Anaerolineae bacterium]
MKGNGAAVLWYALDSQDNDPARFTAHLVEAARVALPDVFAGAGRSLNLGDVIADLLNRLARFASPCLLILDDFHQIHAVEIHTALSMMLEHLPENVRVGIGARADPPVQLPRLRARGQVVELRAADLRFRPAEIAQLFLRTLRLAPSEKRLGQIDQLTEGWAAALRLVTLALDGGAGRLNDAAIDRALQRYSTAQRYILDYFADEVFEQQTAEARRFLLDTSVLNVLTPALCTALNGVDGPRILDSLARAHLFIIPLTDDAPVYRYHHLVEDYLRQRLRTEDPSRFKAQHRAASDWYTLHGDLADAVEHALLSEDYAYTADLIETRAWESLSSRGEIVTIVSWLRAFPDAALDHHPRLCLYFSRALYLIGDIEQSESYVRRAVRILDGLGDAEAARPLRAIALNYRATLAGYRGAVNEGLDLVAQAQPYRAALDPLGRVRLANTAGYLHFLHGDLQAAREAYGEALTLAMGIGHAYLTIDAEAYLAHIAILTGQWSEAEARCEAFLDAQTEKIAPLSALLIPLASVALDRDDRGRAEALLREALDLARQGNILDTVWYASVLLADVVAQRGNMSEAHAFIRQSEQAASAFRSQVLDSLIGAARARLSLRQRLLPEALAWAEYYTRTAPVEFMRSYEDVTLARVWLAHGQPERALAALEGLAAVAERLGRRRDRMETDALRALALQGLGRQAAAL